MKKNNKGFTLTELIVSVAIFGILSVAVLGFVYASSRSYSSVYSSIGLQAESQLALNQVKERLIDCNGAVSFHEDAASSTLRVVCITDSDGDGESESVCHAFRYLVEDGRLYYRLFEGEGDFGGGVDGWEPVAGGLTEFNYTRERDAATVTMSFERRGKTYSGAEVVSLRNSPSGGGEGG